MKQVLTMALVAVVMMMAAGCSKEDGSEELEKRNNMEQALTKEKIVGVWRNGDYWVSFAEDGFMCGYLSDKCIVEGGYNVFQDQIIVVSDFFDYNITAFKITEVTGETLNCDVKYSEIEVKQSTDIEDGHYNETVTLNEAEATMTFTKSQEQPTAGENEVAGKSFEFDSIYEMVPDIGWGSVYEGKVSCKNVGVFNRDGSTTRQFTILIRDNVPNWGIQAHMRDFYVYLAPYIYLIEMHDEEFNIEVQFYKLHQFGIHKMKASFEQNGKVLLVE